MTDHDRLFTTLISTFFEEFILLFFPEAHEEIDFTHLKFLPQEMFADYLEGHTYELDILAENKTLTRRHLNHC